jgi:hypothetical protein
MKKITALLALTAFFVACSNTSIEQPSPAALEQEAAKCTAKPNAILVPSCGAWWGVYAKPVDNQERIEALEALEAKVDRTFDLVRLDYHLWNDDFPSKDELEASKGGRIVQFNWKPLLEDGTIIPWRSIALGKEDQRIVQLARKIKAFGKKAFMTFHHEPDNDVGTAYGSAKDYAAAARRVHDIFEKNGATNAIWMWYLIGAEKFADVFADMYPGDAYVDWISYDTYNRGVCREGRKPWQGFADSKAWFYQYLEKNHPNKPWMVTEYGTDDNIDPTPTKADWILDIKKQIRTKYPKLKGVMYFHSDRGCQHWIDSSPESLEAFKKMGKDPFFNPVRP